MKYTDYYICQERKTHHLIALTLSPTKALANVVSCHKIRSILYLCQGAKGIMAVTFRIVCQGKI